MSFAPDFPWLDLHIWLAAHVPGYQNLEWLARGYESTVYAFVHQDQPWVVRFQRHQQSFVQEAYRTPLLQKRGLPVPSLHSVGAWKHGFYALNPRCQGGPAWQFSAAELVKAVAPTLLRLHTWYPQREETFPLAPELCTAQAWTDFMLAPVKQAQLMPAEAYHLLKTYAPFYVRLLTYLSDSTYPQRGLGLVHGDLSPANVCLERGQLTGILDWGNLAWGDPLLDWVKLLLPVLSPGETAPLKELEALYAQAGLDTKEFFARFVYCAVRVMVVRMTLPIYGDPSYQLQRSIANVENLLSEIT